MGYQVKSGGITRELDKEPLLYCSSCYESRLKGLSQETTLVLSNTRGLDRVPNTKYSTLYTNLHGPC